MRSLRNMFSVMLSLSTAAALSAPIGLAANEDADGERAKNSFRRKFALLVGINDYEPFRSGPDDQTWSKGDLGGCVKDVTDMRDVLVENYGFQNDAEHIKVLLNKDATRDSLIKAFRSQLVEKARQNPNGTFVFHYSGHGASGVPDYNRDDQDGADECIITAERDAIIDDELSALSKELTDAIGDSKEANVTFIFDCCHSATIVRGVEGLRLRQLSLKDVALDKIKKRQQSLAAGQGVMSNGFDLIPSSDKYVCISACLSTQTEPETGDKKSNGVLTRYLTELLKGSTRKMSYRDLRDRLAARITSTYGTDPQIEGDVDRLIFGGATSKADPYIKVSTAGGKVFIKAGQAQGVMKDSVIAFYDMKATQLSGSRYLIGQGTVSNSEPFQSEVSLKGNLKVSDVAASKAVLVTPGFTTQPIVLAIVSEKPSSIPASTFKQFKENIAKETGKDKSVTTVETGSEGELTRIPNWDAGLVFDTFGKFSEILKKRGANIVTAGKVPAADDVVYFLIDRTSQPLFNFWVSASDPDAGKKIANAVMHRARQQALFTLTNATDSPMNRAIDVKVLKITDHVPTADGKSLVIRKEEPVSSTRFIPGSLYRFRVKNTSDSKIYLNILALGTSGRILPIYPFEGDSEALAPKAEINIPTQGAIRANLPAGTDTFRFIASDKRIDFSFLKQEEITTRGSSVRSAQEAAKASGLTQLLFGAMTRDSQVQATPPPPDKWGTTKVECEVLPPDYVTARTKPQAVRTSNQAGD